MVTATRNDSSADGVTLTTTIKFFQEDAGASSSYATDDFFRMQTHSVQHPDGSKQSFAYQRGTWGGGSSFDLSGNNGTDFGKASRISIISGRATGGTSYTTHAGYNIDDLGLVAGQSTLEVIIRDEFAQLRRTETHIWQADAWQLLETVDYDYNFTGQLTSRSSSNYGLYTAAWEGEQKLWEQDETGVKVTYDEYDNAGRVLYSTREGSGAIAAVTTRFSYDAAHRLTESRRGWGLGENIVTARTYDEAGRLATVTPPGLGAVSFVYDPGDRQRITTHPDLSERIETFYADGRLASLTDSAVVEQHYDYQIHTGGLRFTQVKIGSSSSSRVRESWADWLGRTVKTSRPGFSPTSQPAFVEESFYESGTGRLVKTTATGYSAPTRYEYDSTTGLLFRTGIDIGDDGFTLNSTERITEYAQSLESDSGWWLRRDTKVYPEGSGSPITLSVSRTRLSGHPAGRFEESRMTDAEGNVTTRTYDVNRTGRTASVTITRSGYDTETQSFANGLPVSRTGPDGLTFTTQYDSLLRTSSITDPRIGATTTQYQSGSFLPSSVTAAAGLLYTSGYDGLGRKIRHTDVAGHDTRYAYTARGELFRQWGDGTHPVEYEYDSYGDRVALRTYRGAPAGDSENWPSVGTPDTITFAYDAPSGLLSSRTYPNAGSGAGTVSYTYNWRGQLFERLLARTVVGGPNNGQQVTTALYYDDYTDDLTSILYNDDTPDVTYTYNRLGQIATAGSSATGTHTFQYDSGKPWRHLATTLPSFYGTRYQSSLYDETNVKGRYQGFRVGADVLHADDLEQAYRYTSDGRFELLESKRASNTVARNFRYHYLDYSNLVDALTVDYEPYTMDRAYHEDLDLPTSIDSKWNGTSITRFDYTYNNRYLRESAKQSGDSSAGAFRDYGEPTFHRYTYNARGELTAAPAYLGSTVTDTSRPLQGRQHAFAYDSIGNRQWGDRTGVVADREDYTVNALNQYTQKENHAVPVQGTVDSPNTTVAVAGSTALSGRQGRYWAQELTVANATSAVKGTATVYAAKVGGGSGGADLVRTDTRTFFIPMRDQIYGYDLDGNLTHDSVWNYTWDAENRLVSMEHRSEVVDTGMLLNADKRRLVFSYDYMGRRVRKTVYDGWNGSAFSSTQSDTKFLYDGWNLVAEFDASATLKRSFTWGLDMSGSLSATGGIGALLQIRDETLDKTLLATYDGNGNLAALLNADTGAIEATYEYDPFGQLLRAESDYASANPFRFSTKYWDAETGLVYYGHRYYSPGLGRFINRDPSGEAGGLNLYGFALNDSINGGDYLGLNPLAKIRDGVVGIGNWLFGGWGSGGTFADDGFDDIWYDDWWVDVSFDDEDIHYGPDYPSRRPGIISVGALPRVPYAQIARGRLEGPFSATRFYNVPNSTATNPTANPNGFRDLSAGQTPVLINPNANIVRMPTCMDCHALPWQERAQIGLPMDQPWLNRTGTEAATKVFLITSTVPALVGIGMAEAPGLTMLTLKTLLELYSPPTPIEQPPHIDPPLRPVPTGPAK